MRSPAAKVWFAMNEMFKAARYVAELISRSYRALH